MTTRHTHTSPGQSGWFILARVLRKSIHVDCIRFHWQWARAHYRRGAGVRDPSTLSWAWCWLEIRHERARLDDISLPGKQDYAGRRRPQQPEDAPCGRLAPGALDDISRPDRRRDDAWRQMEVMPGARCRDAPCGRLYCPQDDRARSA